MFPGLAQDPSLSPDGSKVAFAWGGDQQTSNDIYVKDIGTGTLLRLTADPADDEYPVWSPDNHYIAFVRSEGRGTGSVMLIRASSADRNESCARWVHALERARSVHLCQSPGLRTASGWRLPLVIRSTSLEASG